MKKYLYILIFISFNANSANKEFAASLTFGYHSSEALLMNITYTGENRYGFFINLIAGGLLEENTPTEANFDWIDYKYASKRSSFGYSLGPAFRLSKKTQLGFGYSHVNENYYYYGYGVSGTPFKNGKTYKESEKGLVAFYEYSPITALSIQIHAGATGWGLAFGGRFDSF